MSIYFGDPPWTCVCGQSNEFKEKTCVYCKVGERGMSRGLWETLKRNKDNYEYEKESKIRKLKEIAKNLPEECQEKEDLVKPFISYDGTIPFEVEKAVFPHRVQKREQEYYRKEHEKKLEWERFSKRDTIIQFSALLLGPPIGFFLCIQDFQLGMGFLIVLTFTMLLYVFVLREEPKK